MRQRFGQTGGKKGVSRTSQLRQSGANAAGLNTPSTTAEKVKFAMKKIGMQNFELVDELAFHMNDNTCMVFKQPKVAIAAHSNCTRVTGNYEVSEGSAQMIDLLNKIKMMPQVASQFAAAGDKATDQTAAAAAAGGNDDDVPELVDDFEAVSDVTGAAKAAAAVQTDTAEPSAENQQTA